MKTIKPVHAILSVALALSEPVLAAGVATNSVSGWRDITGGMARMVRRNTKAAYFINAQSRASLALIDAARTNLEIQIDTPISSTNGQFSFPAPEVKGVMSLYIIDDEKLPMSLIAPEGRWAFVNVAPLAKGRGEKPVFFEARVKKECERIACMLFGGIGTVYRNNLVSTIASAEDLDNYDIADMPMDSVMRARQTLKNLGVKPFRTVTYRQACQEGWAPLPVNAAQKEVWDEIHALPSSPIRIKPETKKVAD